MEREDKAKFGKATRFDVTYKAPMLDLLNTDPEELRQEYHRFLASPLLPRRPSLGERLARSLWLLALSVESDPAIQRRLRERLRR